MRPRRLFVEAPRKRAQSIPRAIGRASELKEVLFQNSAVIGAGTFILLSPTTLIVQGTAQNQRIGNKIRMKSFEVSGCFGGQTLGSLPVTATLFNQLPVTGFTLTDIVGPYVTKDSGTHYPNQIALNDVNGSNTFKLKHTWPGNGKIQSYDKDTGLVTGDIPTLMIYNPSAFSTSGNTVWVRMRFYDL